MSASDHVHNVPPAANSNSHPERDRPRRGHAGLWRSKAGPVTMGFLLVAAFFLFSEHRAHALGLLPYLIILACPLLHLFMHRGHGGHGSHNSNPTTDRHNQKGA